MFFQKPMKDRVKKWLEGMTHDQAVEALRGLVAERLQGYHLARNGGPKGKREDWRVINHSGQGGAE